MNARRAPIAVPAEQLRDLRERLARTRLPDELANDDWRYGTNRDYLADLLSHWGSAYDWRATERRMNEHEHYFVKVGGQPIHFLRSGPQDEVPLLLLGGWAWTFWDFEEVIPGLSDHGLIIPDLHGHGFSSPLRVPGLGIVRAGDLFHSLMTEVLGYRRYGIYGSDWGGLVGAQIAHKHPETIVGYHTTMPFPLDLSPIDSSLWTDAEADLAARTNRFWSQESAYFHLHASRPQTLAYLEDSPAAMAAWLVEKFHCWCHHQGNLEEAYPRQRVLETLSIHWLTRTLGSSIRFYAEIVQNAGQASYEERPVVRVPTGVSVFPGEPAQVPRRWMEDYYDLRHYARMERGGHFPAIENPAALARELSTFFSTVK